MSRLGKAIDEVVERDGEYCFLCWANLNAGVEHHHKRPKGMGGRKGEAKRLSDAAGNLVRLCDVCHGAVHGLRIIRDGHSCRTCPKLASCYFGRKLEGKSLDGVVPPWPLERIA